MKKHVAAFAALAVMGVGAAQASDLVDGKKGVAVTAPLAGGTANAAFNYGVGNLALELGMGYTLTSPDKGDSFSNFSLGVGAHFFALRAEKAALTAGGRFNLGLDSIVDAKATAEAKGETATKNRTSIAIDVPIRVYWFPDEHFSLHFETGLRFAFAGDDGNVYAGKQPVPVALPEGTEQTGQGLTGLGGKTSQFGAFDQFAGIGGTFWW